MINTCRSLIAEAILERRLREAGAREDRNVEVNLRWSPAWGGRINHELGKALENSGKDIVSCDACTLGKRYCSEIRMRNMRLTIENLPSKVNHIVLAESPPKSYKFFYDPYSDGSSWLGSIVFPGFGLETNTRPVEGEAKQYLLTELRSKGVIMVDSCHCACNHLGRAGTREEKRLESGLRARFVLDCLERHTVRIIEEIWMTNPQVTVLPTFPKKHPGEDVLEVLKDRGFRKLSHEEKPPVLRNWGELAGIWIRPRLQGTPLR